MISVRDPSNRLNAKLYALLLVGSSCRHAKRLPLPVREMGTKIVDAGCSLNVFCVLKEGGWLGAVMGASELQRWFQPAPPSN
jgi:hypothetical protein